MFYFKFYVRFRFTIENVTVKMFIVSFATLFVFLNIIYLKTTRFALCRLLYLVSKEKYSCYSKMFRI